MATATQPISIASASSSSSSSSASASQYHNAHPTIWNSPSSVGIHQGPIFSAGSFSSSSVMSSASFGSKLFSNSPSQFIHPLDPNVYKCRVSSSLESDRASKIIAMNHEIANKEEELCRNYNCCGLAIADLHALLEHFEDAHVYVFEEMAQGITPLSYVLPPMPSQQQQLQNDDTPSPASDGADSPAASSSASGVNEASGSTSAHSPAASSSSASQLHQPAPVLSPTPHFGTDSTSSALAGALGANSSTTSSHSPLPSPLRSSFAAASAGSPSDSSSSASSASSSVSSTSSLFMQQQQNQYAQQSMLLQQQQQQPQSYSQPEMDIGMELDFDLDIEHDGSVNMNMNGVDVSMCDSHSPAASGSASGSSSTQGSPQEKSLHSFGFANGSSASASQQQQQMHQQQQGMFHSNFTQQQQLGMYSLNGRPMLGTASALSSPPDTPLLATPVSPANSAGFGQFNSQAWGGADASALGMGYSSFAQNQQQQQTKGPSAFESVHLHLPPKNGLGLQRISVGGGQYQQQIGRSVRGMPPYLSRVNGMNGLSGMSGLNSLGALNAHGMYATSEYSRGVLGLSGLNGNGSGSISSLSGNGSGGAAIPPSLLVGNGGNVASAWNTPMTTPAQSRSGSPTSGGVKKEVKEGRISAPSVSTSSSGSTTANAIANNSNSPPLTPCTPSSATPTPSAAHALLLQKPFRCPKPGCMKSYKQANGLKYHLTHGQCLFTPSAELLALSEEGLTEREAERKLRPFCCQVAPCQRRYKNMNGLRYHYQHSGDHGAVGLAMLAAGTHDATKPQPSPPQIPIGLDDVPMTAQLAQPLSPITTSTAATAAAMRHPNGSAPPTPTSAAAHRMQQQSQSQRKFVFNGNGAGAGVGMSQPPSAYASPFASPAPTRSGSPQSQGQPQSFGGLTQQNMMYQQQQAQTGASAWGLV